MEAPKYSPQSDERANPEAMVSWYKELADALGTGFEHDYGLEEADLTVGMCAFYEESIDKIIHNTDINDLDQNIFGKIIKYMKLRNQMKDIMAKTFIEEKNG